MKEAIVAFEIEIEEDGWPPISVESLKGIYLSAHEVKIDNTPFFVKSISLGDTVRCIAGSNSPKLEFNKVIRTSGNSSLSIILREEGTKEELLAFFCNENCFVEYGEFGSTKMLAVSVPKSIHYQNIRKHLDLLERLDQISYAELCLEH